MYHKSYTNANAVEATERLPILHASVYAHMRMDQEGFADALEIQTKDTTAHPIELQNMYAAMAEVDAKDQRENAKK